MAKTKRKSALKAEYNRQRRRLQQIKRRAEKEGYIFNNDPIPKTPKKITRQSINRLSKIKPEQIREKGVHLDVETGVVQSSKEWQAEKKQRAIEKRKATIQEKKNRQNNENKIDNTLINKEEIQDNINTKKDELKPDITNQQEYEKQYDNDNDDVYTDFSSHVVNEFYNYLDGMPRALSEPISQYVHNLVYMFGEQAVAEALQNMDETVWDIFERVNYDYEECVTVYTQRLLDCIPDEYMSYLPQDIKDNQELMENFEAEDFLGYAF